MKITIDTQLLCNANEFGEILRQYCFIPSDKYGCYQTFDLKKEFYRPETKEATKFIDEILSSTTWWGKYYQNTKYQRDAIMQKSIRDAWLENVYTNGNIWIAWYWDGDGCLAIKEEDKLAINNDCKCDDYWEWVEYE